MANQIKVILSGQDQLSSTLNKVTKGPMAQFRRAAIGLAAPLAAAFSVRTVQRFATESFKVAAEADRVWSSLGQALNNVGVEFDDVRGRIEANAASLQNLTTVGDEEYAQVLTELTTTSGDFKRSLDTVSVVADLAAAKQIDLRTAAQLVGRAMVGQTGSLTRYGIVVREGQDAVEAIRQSFRGFAQVEGASLEGQLGRIADRWDDFKQAIGTALSDSLNGQSVLEKVNELIQDMTGYIENNRDRIADWGKNFLDFTKSVIDNLPTIIDLVKSLGIALGVAGVAGALFKIGTAVKAAVAAFKTGGLIALIGPQGLLVAGVAVLTGALFLLRDYWGQLAQAAGGALQIIWNGLKAVFNSTKALFFDVIASIGRLWNEFSDKINWILNAFTAITGIEVPFEAWTAPTEEWRQAADDAFEAVEDNIETMKQGAVVVGQAFKDMWRDYTEGAQEAEEEAANVPGATTRTRSRAGEPPPPAAVPDASGPGLNLTSQLGGDIEYDSEDINAKIAEASANAQAAMDRFMEPITRMAENIKRQLENTFGNAVEAGFRSAFSGEGISQSLQNFGSVILQGLGRIFIQMGKQLIGFGKIMETLKAFLTNPLTAGPAAIAAGAALIALGAALSAIATRGGGRGRGALTGASSGLRRTVDGIPRDGINSDATTIVKVNGSKVFFDLNDPVQQKNFASMFETVRGNRKVILQTS